MLRRRRRKHTVEYRDIELNIMPFIDVFSMLNTFLLFSAVFIALGMIEVQIPFLSNAEPPDKPKRSIEIKVDVFPDKVEVSTAYNIPPPEEQKWTYPLTEQGLNDMHTKLAGLRNQYKEADKLTVYSEDDVTYDKLTLVLDAAKLRREGDPLIVPPQNAGILEQQAAATYLYPKVVIGSVIL